MAGPIGIYGGTFDPVHRGHVETAADVCKQLDLEVVHFIANATPSHRGGPVASPSARHEMLELALSGHAMFFADDREIRRGGLSYSVDTLIALRKQYGPKRPLVLILGADAFLGLPTWNRWQRVFELAHVVVINRPGTPLGAPPADADWWRERQCDDPLECLQSPAGLIVEINVQPVDVSSTEIRRRLQSGEPVDGLIAPDVKRFILRNGLYRVLDSEHGEESTQELIDLIETGLQDAKARDVYKMDVRGLTDVTDYMVIASGTSDRHVRAVAASVIDEAGEHGLKPTGHEGEETADWILLDFGAAIVHVMKQSAREFYDLEGLWSEELKTLVARNRESASD